MKPPNPKLTPITRQDRIDGAVHLIPRSDLEAQVREMDRCGTWHLAQALAIAEHVEQYPVDDERWRQAQFDRHLKLAGALLGSINSRVTAFKFLQEGNDGQYAGGHPEPYRRSR